MLTRTFRALPFSLLLAPTLVGQGLVSSLDQRLQSPLVALTFANPVSQLVSNCTLPWDFDNDGDVDVLVGYPTGLALLRNDGCTGTFTDVKGSVLGTSSFGVMPNPGIVCGAIGDIDGDGDDDAVVSTTLPYPNWVILGGIDPVTGLLATIRLTVADPAMTTTVSWPQLAEISLVDLTKDVPSGGVFALDGRLDIVACAATTYITSATGPGINITRHGRLYVAAGTVPGPFGMAFIDRSPPQPVSTTVGTPDSNYTSIAVADFTGDGRPDVVVGGATLYTGVYASLQPALQWPLRGVDRFYVNSATSAVLVDATVAAFVGASTPQQRGNAYSAPFDVDGDGDMDLVTSASIVSGSPSTVPNSLNSPIVGTVQLRFYPNNGFGASPQFGLESLLATVSRPVIPAPTSGVFDLPFGDFIVGDLFGDDGVDDLIHSAQCFRGMSGGMMTPTDLASPVLPFGLNGAVLDLDCSQKSDLLVSSYGVPALPPPPNIAYYTSHRHVVQVDKRLRLDGPADAFVVGGDEVAVFNHLDFPSSLSVLALSVTLIPPVAIPGFNGRARVVPDIWLPLAGNGRTDISVPLSTALVGSYYFQSIDLPIGPTAGSLGFSNVVRTVWDSL
jgi:hypothetical protein